VAASANPSNAGVITGAGTFASGAQVTVIATPFPGFVFNEWTENGNVVSTSASYTFTLSADRNLVANFSANNTFYTITLEASPANGGFVVGSGSYLSGTLATVSAIPNRKFVFSGWSENGVVVSTNTSYAFTVDTSHDLVAQFVTKRRGRHR
jgi:Divergent InlB B-repeat domain